MELSSLPTPWAGSGLPSPLWPWAAHGLPWEPFMDLLPGVMCKGCSPPCFPCWSSRAEQLGGLGAERSPGLCPLLPAPVCSVLALPWAQPSALAPCLLQPDLIFPLAFTCPGNCSITRI